MTVFLALTDGDTDNRRRIQAAKACVYMFFILALFLMAGTHIITFFGISIPGIQIAGGLMVMKWAYSLLNPAEGGRKISKQDEFEAKTKGDVSFSPLAMPLLSGPGSIAVVLGLAANLEDFLDYGIIIIAIALVAVSTYIIFYASPWVTKLLGGTGMTALTRMMGFIALCIGVQFIINGITAIVRTFI